MDDAGAPQSRDNLRGLYEPHRSRVHTVAETCWAGTVIEHVAKMSIALATGDSRALHSQAHIAYLDDVLLCDRLPEARPASAGFKFRFGTEDGVVAADASVKAVVVIIPGAAGKGALRTCMPGDLV